MVRYHCMQNSLIQSASNHCPCAVLSVLLVAVCTVAPCVARAAGPLDKIDVGQFPAALYDDLVIPVPSEVFGVLDKLGSPDWNALLPASLPPPSQDRAQIALQLGRVIADGFIAVQAKNQDKVKDIGREVLRLAGAIGVRNSVIARSRKITEAADARDWLKVKREFDGAMQDVKRAMVELRDDDLAQLVSLGGWLRGTQVLTQIVGGDYSSETAELLHQPALLDYFSRRIAGMPPTLRDNTLVANINDKLTRIRPLIAIDDGRSIGKDSVESIRLMTTEVVAAINSPQA